MEGEWLEQVSLWNPYRGTTDWVLLETSFQAHRRTAQAYIYANI